MGDRLGTPVVAGMSWCFDASQRQVDRAESGSVNAGFRLKGNNQYQLQQKSITTENYEKIRS